MAEQDKFEAMEVKTRKQLEQAAIMKKKKKRNYIVGFSLLGAGIIALIVIYILASQIWLVDLAMLPYVTYTYSTNKDGVTTAEIIKVKDTKEKPAPKHFTIPTKVNGLPVVSIGDSALAGCMSIESVEMSPYVTSIGSYAFAGCENLKSIKFSPNINNLGTEVFKGTAYLKSLPTNNISIISQILFNVGGDVIKPNTVLLASHESKVPAGYEDANIFYLDEYDGKVLGGWGEALFLDNHNIVYAEIPSYLKEIPANSFKGCVNLKEVSIPKDVEIIGESAFEGATSLTKVNLVDGLKTIGDLAFAETSLTDLEIPSTVTKLGRGLMMNNKVITSYTWPAGQTAIPEKMFSGCDKLTNIVISPEANKSIKSIGDYAFEGTAIPSFTFPENLQNVAEGLFLDDQALTSVKMRQSNTYYDKEGLKQTFGIVSFGAMCFQNTALEEIILIDAQGHELTPHGEINLPKDSSAFLSFGSEGGQFEKTNITKFTFPYTVKATSNGMFENAPKLQEVHFNTYHKAGRVTGLETIEANTFKGVNLITELTMPDSIRTIFAGAFSNMQGLKTFTFPNEEYSLYRSIDAQLFENDGNLEKVTLNGNIRQISKYSFHNNFKLEYVYIPYNYVESASKVTDLNILNDAFYNMRKAEYIDENGQFVSKEVRDNKGHIDLELMKHVDKMPIFLELRKEDISNKTMPEAVYKDPTDKSDPNTIYQSKRGWYDVVTCQPYYKGEWHWENGVPTPNPVEGGDK